MNMDDPTIPVQIQIQDQQGVWRPVFFVTNNSQRILVAMSEAQRQYKGKRVRAINALNSQLINIM